VESCLAWPGLRCPVGPRRVCSRGGAAWRAARLTLFSRTEWTAPDSGARIRTPGRPWPADIGRRRTAPDLPGWPLFHWGSRGRRFKSGRPDAGQKAGSGFQLPAFGCNGSARPLPSVAPAKRSGVFCRPGMLTSDYRHSACSRAGSRLSPADSGELSPGQGVADSDPAVKNWFWATAADGRASASGCHFVRLSPRRPTSSARAADAPCHRRWGSPPIGQLVANPPHRSSRPLAGPVAFQQC
jgi:hypothetical protein